ncbi:hypothetical protein [Empedobacter brevis]|uniref:hypothetical protein n=1 Tax=Empedobacter brevis TaxID=247 RepID=UPI0039B09A18
MKVSTILIFILSFLIGITSCNFKSDEQQYAEELIEKVEFFRKINNRIPDNVSEIGILEEMDSPAFYQKENDSTYIIWYGLGIGESNVYNSLTKEWKKEG